MRHHYLMKTSFNKINNYYFLIFDLYFILNNFVNLFKDCSLYLTEKIIQQNHNQSEGSKYLDLRESKTSIHFRN